MRSFPAQLPHGIAPHTPTCVLALGSFTALALALNLAMECDPAAQERYAATYGEPWSPLPMPGADDELLAIEALACATPSVHRASGSAALTVAR